MVVCLDALRIDLNCVLEVFDCHLMVTHVLVDKTSLNVDGLIFWQLLHDSRKLSESFLEFTGLAEHETLVEH